LIINDLNFKLQALQTPITPVSKPSGLFTVVHFFKKFLFFEFTLSFG